MLSKTLQNALNEQMNNEFFAEFEYLSMAAYFHSMSLDGMANYFHVQAEEEHFHAMKIYNFINDKGGKIILKPIKAPDVDFKSPLHVFETALKQELSVTRSINKLMDTAIKENDHAVHSFLKWYVDEQVEEEALATKNVERMKMIKGQGEGLLLIDQDMTARKFTPQNEA